MNRPKQTGTTVNAQATIPTQALIVERIESNGSAVDPMGVDAFDFIDHTYFGSHGYRDRTYLIPHTRETGYQTRRKASYYINIARPAINCMVDPVFSEPVKRTFENEMFQQFTDNADNCGTSMQNIVKDIIHDARRKDISFCVIDNFTAEELEQYKIQKDAMANRLFPFIYMRRKQDAYKWETNRFGALETITFYDELRTDIKPKETIQTFKRWDKNQWVLYYEQKSKDGKEIIEVEVNSGVHGRGKLPVYPVLDFARTKNLKTIPDPSLYDLCVLCCALFNKESQAVHLEMMQGFSLLCLSAADAKTVETIGAANFISVSNDAKFSPTYASPDPSHLVNLIANCDRLEEKIYKALQQKGVIAIQSQTSGVSKEWDFRAEEKVLKATAQAAENLEYWIASMFSESIRIAFEYNVKYAENYSPTYQSDQIKEGLAIIDMNPPRPLAAREWKEIAIRRYGRDEDSNETLIAELEAEEELRRDRLLNDMKRQDDKGNADDNGDAAEIIDATAE